MYTTAVEEDVFVFPVSFAQQRLWFLDQLQPGDPTYNIFTAVRLRGPLDITALKSALNEVVRRHESLRTTFAEVEGQTVQIVTSDLSLELPVIRLDHLEVNQRDGEFERMSELESQTPFDLSQWPLMRAKLLRMSEADHVFFLTMHHIISDGWSMGVLVRELATFYGARVTGRLADAPELPIQYADYASWQRETLHGEALESQLAYWRRQLANSPTGLELPADRPRPPVRTFESASQSIVLSEKLSESLRALSRRHSVTLFMTLLAVFKILFHRYTLQEEIVVGSPIAGRNRAETKALIGFFLNTLVLRTNLGGNPTFRELLERVKETTTGAYAHEDLPFEKLLEELQPERDLSRTPLFQVFFNMLNLPDGEIELPDLTVELIPPRDVGAKFDATIYVRELNRRIAIELVYNADLFTGERMTHTLSQFEWLLSQVVDNPDRQIAEYSLVTAESQKTLPDPTEALSSKWEGAVHAIFSQQARRTPERVAISGDNEAWTYGDLESRANKLANYMRAQGTVTGDIVAIYGHRSPALVWAVIGTLKAGAAFLILDPAYPSARLVDYLEVAKPKGWIQLEAAGSLPTSLQDYVSSMQCRFRLELPARAVGQQLSAMSSDEPDVEVRADDLAYISFTSGSTGRPKGVQGCHGSLTHFLPWLQRTFGLDHQDRYSMLSGLSHDPLHRDIFTPLQLGASICIPSREDLEVPGRLAEWMQREQVTITHLTPAMGQLLTETFPGHASREIDSLRCAFLVGDVLTKRDVAKLRTLAPRVTVVNYYGSTETQRAVSYHVALNDDDHSDEHGKQVLPLGKGIEDVQLLVLNASQSLAGIGETGEIYLRSPHIARGYLDEPVLTSERFIINPFAGMADDWLYRTGDLGRYLPNGEVEPLGRADQQVKIRGFRVELGEIEAVIGTYAGVREAVCIAREDEPGEKRLVAYLVAEDVSVAQLRDSLRQKLPDYMMPSAFVMLDALPLTPNRKVDRRALPAPSQYVSDTEANHVDARTQTEEVLAAIWADVLKLDRVSVCDNFFDCGGHSLLAIKVVARVREAFAVELPLRSFFESPTVASLAVVIDDLKQVSSTAPLRRVDRGERPPLSSTQEGLWFIHRFAPESPAYNIFAAARLVGDLDLTALQASVNEIVRRHETLRTAFAEVDELPALVIADELELPIAHLEHSEWSESEKESQIVSLAIEESRRPFNLTRQPLLRVNLVKLRADEHVLLLTMHHIIGDGWSIGILLRELATLYEAYTVGRPSPLPDLPIQYADFAAWQREWMRGPAFKSQLAYWRLQLASAPSLVSFPTDNPRPAVLGQRGAREYLTLPAQLYEGLKALSRAEGVTLYVTILAAYMTLLHRYTGLEDVVVGSPIAGRSRIETEGLIGFFANTFVIRGNLAGNPTFRQLIGRVRDVTLQAYSNQDVPFDKVVEELRPKRRLSQTSLFQLSFSLQTTFERLQVPGLTLSRIPIDNGTAMFELVLNMQETEQGLGGTLEYNTDLFHAETVKRLLHNYELLLTAAVAHPDSSLNEIEAVVDDGPRVAGDDRKESLAARLKGSRRKAFAVTHNE
ncbi:MAG TPA: amino acid adenylation domain-containing protein [Pyrinomonadaceae bacterium]|nr:amino acid adenylation domain-containing protein [Pyrinomonadaceae bacterium]